MDALPPVNLQVGDIILHSQHGRGTVRRVAPGSVLYACFDFEGLGEKWLFVFYPNDCHICEVNGEPYTHQSLAPLCWGGTASRPNVFPGGASPKSATVVRSIVSAPDGDRPSTDATTRKQQVQTAIVELRKELLVARNRADSTNVEALKSKLVDRRLEFAQLLRPCNPADLAPLREQVSLAVSREAEKTIQQFYKNVCWVCHGDVSSLCNDRCACQWYICVVDGACQDPRFWSGERARQLECGLQVARIGAENYSW
jgi:hypothetical protein